MCEKLDLTGVRIYSNTKADIIDAMDLLGEEVYLSDWEDFNPCTKDKLIDVIYSEDDHCSFFAKKGQAKWGYRFFILAKDAKFVEEKKLRPFKNVEEFISILNVVLGRSMIRYRKKGAYHELVMMFSGYTNGYNKKITEESVVLGSSHHSLTNLFEDYEYYDNDNSKWQPFGVEVR